jgi:signal transduction histidine kinase
MATQPDAPPPAEVRATSKLRQVLTVVVAGFLLLVGYFSIWTYQNTIEQAEAATLNRLAGIVYTLSMQLDGDAHERLVQRYPGQDDIRSNAQDSLYQSIHTVLRRNHAANMLQTPMYTIVATTGGYAFAVSSAETPYYRHPYHSAPEPFLAENRDNATVPCYRDEFGTWLSAFAAVKNRAGQTVAWVQADERFDDFIEKARTKALLNLLPVLLVFAAFLAVLVRIIQPILKNEQRQRDALQAALRQNREISRQLEQSLGQVTALDDFRKEMVANISHDLRTPLASILGYLETVVGKQAQLDAVERRRFLDVALIEARRLQRLVGDLFDLSKLESGQIQLQVEPFSIAELAQDVLQKYQIQAEEKQVKLLTEFAPNLPLVSGDIRWLDRVLQNLLDNALRYAEPDGFVMITLFPEREKVHLKVCNSGNPIPEANLPKVFDRYFKSTDRKKAGAGLGLTIVKKIVDLHGERVWAEVNGEVTTFRFTLNKLQ